MNTSGETILYNTPRSFVVLVAVSQRRGRMNREAVFREQIQLRRCCIETKVIATPHKD